MVVVGTIIFFFILQCWLLLLIHVYEMHMKKPYLHVSGACENSVQEASFKFLSLPVNRTRFLIST